MQKLAARAKDLENDNKNVQEKIDHMNNLDNQISEVFGQSTEQGEATGANLVVLVHHLLPPEQASEEAF